MKLAEALMRRADLNRLIGEVGSRLSLNAQVEEGEDTEENPEDLATNLYELVREQEVLIFNINRTNIESKIEVDGKEVTLQEAILRKDALQKRHSGLSNLLVNSKRSIFGYGGRHSKDDVKYVPAIDQKELRKDLDALAAERRRVDTEIQRANWTVDLVE